MKTIIRTLNASHKPYTPPTKVQKIVLYNKLHCINSAHNFAHNFEGLLSGCSAQTNPINANETPPNKYVNCVVGPVKSTCLASEQKSLKLCTSVILVTELSVFFVFL